MAPMDDAFLVVVVTVSLLAFAVAVVALATSGGSYDQIGSGGLAPAEDERGGDRDAEIRQYLAARNARRAARGQAPIDVEDELRALTAPSADPELAAEVRQVVEARNARRVARGQAALDVEAEVARLLRGA